ncbi:transcription factor TFIIIB subunit brf1 [Physocladia obscura]|uniref:B-related factor 1 n=1 Tax=Physocladia obscura TaxID=109957 RepID=A0AAD5SUZ1_9FUNG|nr:transcription factor TFIIIB subunit brf1 [Physocladia obscura]
MAICGTCGSADLEYEPSLGHQVCRTCGEVLEQNAIVSEVTFTEGAGADGFFVAKGSARASRGPNRMGVKADAGASREQTLRNGHNNIANIGHQMRMTVRQIEEAQRFFNMAVVSEFRVLTKRGKKTNEPSINERYKIRPRTNNNNSETNKKCYVRIIDIDFDFNLFSKKETLQKEEKPIALLPDVSMLSVSGRFDQTSHMLIDFSEHLQINVFVLGNTFVRLVQVLQVAHSIPLVDPVLYIVRFANKLDFGDETPAVIRDANRVVSRMDRDWIVKGRKPAGICAAALFIAARMHGFARTPSEIASVVKICEATLIKRLIDFKQTPSSELSVNEFKDIMLESSQDPPSFAKKRKMSVVADSAETDTSNSNNNSTKRNSITATTLAQGKNDDNDNDYDQDGDGKGQENDNILNDIHQHLRSKAMQAAVFELGVTNLDFMDVSDLAALDNDREIEGCLLSEEEIVIKTMIWEIENKDWERQKMAAAAIGPKPTAKKPRKKREPGTGGSSSTSQHPGMNLLASKPALSKKINYEMISTLFNDDQSFSVGGIVGESSSSGDFVDESVVSGGG